MNDPLKTAQHLIQQIGGLHIGLEIEPHRVIKASDVELVARALVDSAAACEERVRLLNQAIDGFMRDALVAIAGAVCTPEKGYLEDGGLRLLLRDITELRRMHDHYRKRMQSDEDQLCRIAKAIGKDATGAPEHDRTIAGAAIETLTAAKARITELEREVTKYKSLASGFLESLPPGVMT